MKTCSAVLLLCLLSMILVGCGTDALARQDHPFENESVEMFNVK